MNYKKKVSQLFLIGLFLYAFYFVCINYYSDYVFPPARQSIFFLNDILLKKIKINQPRTIILGDSTAVFGYSAGELPNTLSLAIFNGSFAEMYYAYQKYLAEFPPPRCIVLSASYNWAYHRDGRFWETYAANSFYNWEDLNELYDTSVKVNDFPSIIHSRIGFFAKFLLYKLRLQGVHLTDIQDAIFKKVNFKGNMRFAKGMRKNAGSINKSNMLFPFIWEPHAHLDQAFRNAPLYDEYLRRLVELANSKGTRLHWVQLPISSRVYTEMAKKHFVELEKHLAPIILNSSLNTFDGKVKIYPDSHFFSATHLNILGAKRFSSEQKFIFEKCN